MRKKQFEELLTKACKEFSGQKKAPSTPSKQFEKGARWLWDLLMGTHDTIYYEEVLRSEVADRLDRVEVWQESLIHETAKMMARRDNIEATIQEQGYLLTKHDKNVMPYKEANPLIAHQKELDRSIGMQREHLGLSFRVNPMRMKESPKTNVDTEKDKLAGLLTEAKQNINSEVPEIQ